MHRNFQKTHMRLRTMGVVVLAMVMGLLTLQNAAAQQAGALPAALELVPAGAQMVVVIPNLSALSLKIANLNNGLGLGVPGMGDTLGELKQSSGLVTGVRDEGSLLVVLPELPVGVNGNAPTFLIFLPVIKYGDFAKSLGGGADQAIAELKLPDGQVLFSKNIGGESGYALLCAQKGIVESYKAGGPGAITDAAGKVGTKALSGSDVAVILNVQSMAPTLQPMLQAGMATAIQEASKTQTDPAAAATTRAVLSMYSDGLSAFLRDTTVSVISFDLSEQGIGMSATAQFKPNSYLASVFVEGGAAAPMISRLPDRPYLIATAMNFGRINIKALVADALAKMPDAATGGPMVGMVRESLPLLASAQGMAQAYYVPAMGGGMGSGLLQGINVVQAADSKAYLQAYQQQLLSLNNKQFPVGKPTAGVNNAGASIGFTTQYSSNAIQVDGVSIDQYQMNFTLPPELLAQAGPMLALLGGTGYSGYAAALNNTVVSTTVPDVQLIKVALDAIRQDSGFGGEGSPIAAVRKNLPAGACVESYVNLAGVASLANLFIPMLTGGPAIVIPPDLKPVGMGIGIENSGLVYRTYLPMDALRFIKQIGTQFSGMAAGGAPKAAPAPGQGAPPAPF